LPSNLITICWLRHAAINRPTRQPPQGNGWANRSGLTTLVDERVRLRPSDA